MQLFFTPRVNTPLECAQQLLFAFGNKVDNVQLNGFMGRGRNTFGHDLLSPILVAAALFRQTSRIGNRVVGHLFHHGFTLLAAASGRSQRNRRGRTKIGSGRHCRKICRQRN